MKYKTNLLLLSFLTSFCSLFYDLVFSQLTSVFLGSTILSYSLNLGVYILALSFGAIFHKNRIFLSKELDYLFFIEVALSCCGFLACYLQIGLFKLVKSLPDFFQYTCFFIPVAIIGVLSGFELPFLMREGKLTKDQSYILGFDFIGMFAATLFFPVLFFHLGLFHSSFIAGFINLIVAYRILLLNKNKSFIKKMIICLLGLFFILLFIFDSKIAVFRSHFLL